MIKIIGCFIILAASTVGGFVYAEKFKNRVKELNEIERAIYQLQGEIEYTHTPLPEALQNVAKKSKAPIDMLFDKASKLLYSNEVESVFDAFNKVFKESTATLNINLEDRNVVLDLAKSLGESDIEGHKKIFEISDNRIEIE